MITKITSEDPGIDLSYLKEFSNGDPVFERDILESSLLEADEKIQALEVSILKNDFEKVKQIAHSLKSLMSVMGCEKLRYYFYKLEQDIESGSFSSINVAGFANIKELWKEDKMKIKDYTLMLSLTDIE